MGSDISVGGSLDIGLLAAGVIFAYGVWVGRRDLGQRAALGVLGAMLWSVLPSLMVITNVGWLMGWLGLLITPASFLLSIALGFLPVLVAVNWLGVIRQEVQPD